MLRLFLITGALVLFYFVAYRIRKSMILMGDAIFWVLFSILLIVLAVFPGIAFWFSEMFGFISPSNFVFLCIIAILLAKMFANSSEISLLKYRINEIAQENALLEKRVREEEAKKVGYRLQQASDRAQRYSE
nr:DUF2304 domain-containing protein [Enorma phocaeensis]